MKEMIHFIRAIKTLAPDFILGAYEVRLYWRWGEYLPGDKIETPRKLKVHFFLKEVTEKSAVGYNSGRTSSLWTKSQSEIIVEQEPG